MISTHSTLSSAHKQSTELRPLKYSLNTTRSVVPARNHQPCETKWTNELQSLCVKASSMAVHHAKLTRLAIHTNNKRQTLFTTNVPSPWQVSDITIDGSLLEQMLYTRRCSALSGRNSLRSRCSSIFIVALPTLQS